MSFGPHWFLPTTTVPTLMFAIEQFVDAIDHASSIAAEILTVSG
jgi:hypothetical protein